MVIEEAFLTTTDAEQMNEVVVDTLPTSGCPLLRESIEQYPWLKP